MDRPKFVKVSSFTLGVGAQQLIGGDINRIAVYLFSTNSAGLAAFRFGELPTAISDGLTITFANHPIILTREDIGDEIRKSINCFASNGTVVNVMEVFGY